MRRHNVRNREARVKESETNVDFTPRLPEIEAAIDAGPETPTTLRRQIAEAAERVARAAESPGTSVGIDPTLGGRLMSPYRTLSGKAAASLAAEDGAATEHLLPRAISPTLQSVFRDAKTDPVPRVVQTGTARLAEVCRHARTAGDVQRLERVNVSAAESAMRKQRARGLIYVYEGSRAGDFALLEDRVVSIGRNADENTLVIDDRRVSGKHCEIRPVDGGYQIVDAGSTLGTFVNDKLATRKPLSNGDIVTCGDTRIIVRIL
jgi:hypothetical protein